MTKEAFVQLVENAEESMYRVSCAYLKNDYDRADALQEAVLKAWQKRETLREQERFPGWITRILIRECLNICRAGKRVTPVAAVPEAREAAPSPAPIREAMDQLPDKIRGAAVLYYLEGYGVKETASILRIPAGTVNSRLNKARKLLREALKEEWR